MINKHSYLEESVANLMDLNPYSRLWIHRKDLLLSPGFAVAVLQKYAWVPDFAGNAKLTSKNYGHLTSAAKIDFRREKVSCAVRK